MVLFPLKIATHFLRISPSVLLVQWTSAVFGVCVITALGPFWAGVLMFLPSPLGCSSSSSSPEITPSPLPLPNASLLRLTVYPGLVAFVHWASMMYLWPSTQPQTALTEPQHWPSSTSFRSGQERQASPCWWAQDTRLWRHLWSEVKEGGAERKPPNVASE